MEFLLGENGKKGSKNDDKKKKREEKSEAKKRNLYLTPIQNKRFPRQENGNFMRS